MSRLLGCALVLASLVGSSSARAAGGEEDVRPSVEPKSAERRSFVAGNVIGLPFGHVAFDAGSMLAPHLAPVASLHLQAMPPIGKRGGALAGIGGELGVRLYTDARSPSGGFAGIFVSGGRYYESKELLGKEDGVDVITYGAAFDLGWSFVLPSGIQITIGAGIQKRWSQRELRDRPAMPDDTPSGNGDGSIASYLFTRQGLSPRVLTQLGYAF